MDQHEFAADLRRRDGFRIVYASLRPNMREADHCHDLDARLFVLGGEITITRDNNPEPSILIAAEHARSRSPAVGSNRATAA